MVSGYHQAHLNEFTCIFWKSAKEKQLHAVNKKIKFWEKDSDRNRQFSLEYDLKQTFSETITILVHRPLQDRPKG